MKELSTRFALLLRRHQIADDNNIGIYIYGLELLCSTAISIMSILFLSYLIKPYYIGIIFLVYLIPLRLTAGGFHANTYASCFILTNALFLITIASVRLRLLHAINMFLPVLLLLAFVYIWIQAPIEHIHVPLCEAKKIKNKNRTRKILLIELAGIFLFYITRNDYMKLSASVTIIIVAILMFVAKKTERRVL